MSSPNLYFDIVNVRTKQYPNRLFPMVLLEDGQPCVTINSFANYLLGSGEQEQSLHRKVRTVCSLYEFTRRQYGLKELNEEELRTIIFEFGQSKLHGTIDLIGNDPLGLYWKPVKAKTAKQQIKDVRQFDEFQSTFFNAKPISKHEQVFLSNYERYLEFQRREKYDPFLHLFATKEHTKRVYDYDIKEHSSLTKSTSQKVFPADKVIEIIEASDNIRDKLVLLLLAFGGLRKSELLHLMTNDIVGQFKDTSSAWVVLAHPETGMVTWLNDSGNTESTTREKYLSIEFKNDHLPGYHPLHKIRPRTLYSKHDKEIYAGFKGMTFTGSGIDNFVHWSNEGSGIYFWKLYEQYLATYFYNQPSSWPYHPFLFIKLDSVGYGMPMTSASIDKLFERCCKKIGLTGYTPHSMRHFYGYYLASVVELPPEKAQVCLRHASIESTQVYYRVAPEIVRKEILLSQGVGGEIEKTGKYKLEIPNSWL